ncbi:MAG: multicopper oxidase family protein [Frankia sp.]
MSDATDEITTSEGPARRLPARKALLLVLTGAVVLASAIGTAIAAYSGPSRPGGPPPSLSAAAQEAGMASGQPFADPRDIDALAGPNLKITLDAANTVFDLSGRRVKGQAYNGSFIAPTMHFVPGQQATITLVNHLPVATNLHFHGMHVSPSGDSDNPFVCVAPGRTFVYHLDIPADHPIGTFWYHSHATGTACAMSPSADMPMGGDVENQVFAGLSGAIVVGDDRTLLPPALRDITAHTLVLKDVQIDGSGQIAQRTGTSFINPNNPTVRLVNGQLRPVLALRPGETQLWRLINAGADIFYQLALDGYHFTVINEDGRPVARVTHPATLVMPPGKRYDVLVTAGNRPGRTTLRTTTYNSGPAGPRFPDVALAQVAISGRPVPGSGDVSGAIPSAPPNLAGAPIAQRRTVVLAENNTHTQFFINGRQGTMGGATFTAPAVLGTVEEWTIVNNSLEDHPFHFHTNAFQVMSVDGRPQPYDGRADEVVVPHGTPGSPGSPGKVVLRIAFADYTGRWMFHCHIAGHEDSGMMGYVNVVAPAPTTLPFTL